MSLHTKIETLQRELADERELLKHKTAEANSLRETTQAERIARVNAERTLLREVRARQAAEAQVRLERERARRAEKRTAPERLTKLAETLEAQLREAKRGEAEAEETRRMWRDRAVAAERERDRLKVQALKEVANDGTW